MAAAVSALSDQPDPQKHQVGHIDDLIQGILRRHFFTFDDIKVYRQYTHLGLREARAELQAVLDKLPWHSPRRTHLVIVTGQSVFNRLVYQKLDQHPLVKGQINMDVRYDAWEAVLANSYKPQVNIHVTLDTDMLNRLAPNHVGASMYWNTDERAGDIRIGLPNSFSHIEVASADGLAWVIQSLLIRSNPAWWEHEKGVHDGLTPQPGQGGS